MGEDVRRDLGLRARRRVIDVYGLGAVTARYEALYDEVAARGRAARVA
jgi:hypothetical protein